jgi:mRNA interferase RelE/StbE
MPSFCTKTRKNSPSSHSSAGCGAVGDYRIVLKSFAASRIEAVDPRAARCRIRGQIAVLADEPRPPVAEPLPGYANRFRIRVGRFRILYEVDESRNEVTIVSFECTPS